MELLEDLNRKYRRYRHNPRERTFLGLNGLQPVLSSNVSAVGVKGDDLIIRFHNGSVYSYRNRATDYENILKSNSKGKWVWRFLRRANAFYTKLGVVPLPDDIGVTDEDIFQEIDNRYLSDLVQHVDVPVFQSFEFIKGINYQKIVVGDINVYKAVLEPLELLQQVTDQTIDLSSMFDDKGNELSDTQRETFKDSKVRDEKGNLLRLYHGSPNTNIKKFSTKYKGLQSGVAEDVIYFTNDLGMAKEYSAEKVATESKYVNKGTGRYGKVYEVYIDIKNPLDFRNLTEKDIDFLKQSYMEQFNEDEATADHFINTNVTRTGDKIIVKNDQLLKMAYEQDQAIKAGYDGVIHEMYVDSGIYEYGVFNAEQIQFANEDENNQSDDVDELNNQIKKDNDDIPF